MTDRSVSVGSVTSPTDPTLGLRIEIGRLVGWSVGGRTFGRSVVGFAYVSTYSVDYCTKNFSFIPAKHKLVF